MYPSPHDQPQSARPPAQLESPVAVLIAAAIFLYFGFVVALTGASDHAVYNWSVTGFTWMARIVGIGLLLTAAMIMWRMPGVATVNLIVSVIAAAGCLLCGAIWMAYGDMEGVLLLAFGLLNGNAARGAWQAWRAGR